MEPAQVYDWCEVPPPAYKHMTTDTWTFGIKVFHLKKKKKVQLYTKGEVSLITEQHQQSIELLREPNRTSL